MVAARHNFRNVNALGLVFNARFIRLCPLGPGGRPMGDGSDLLQG